MFFKQSLSNKVPLLKHIRRNMGCAFISIKNFSVSMVRIRLSNNMVHWRLFLQFFYCKLCFSTYCANKKVFNVINIYVNYRCVCIWFSRPKGLFQNLLSQTIEKNNGFTTQQLMLIMDNEGFALFLLTIKYD